MNEIDNIRLEEFRQLKKEIRGSKEYLIVGIDVAKDKHNAFFSTAMGKAILKRLVFENNIAGFEKLLTQAEALKVYHNFKKIVFGMEPTANYHKPLGEHLIKCGHNVVLVSGLAVNKNREMLDGRWDKNDIKDPGNIADLISQGKCLYYDYPSMQLRDLRNLVSLKRRLKKQEHGVKVRIRNHLLAQYFPELDRYFGGAGSEGLAIVKWCLDPSVIAGLEYDEFVHLVAPRIRSMGQQKRLKAIWEMAADSIGCEVGQALDFEAKLMVEYLQQVRESISAIDDRIEEICLGFPEYRYLLSIPGFGPDVSSKVLGAIGNPFRFNNGKQVLKLTGYDLSASRSGKTSDTAVPVISKRGKAYLRYALYQAAFIASTRNRHFIIYYTNKLRGREREKGIKTKMRVKLAAKMLIIAWTLMKKKELFDPEYLNID
ncbi:MAG: IS110 family transposase [Deltaproteobacteria bacterium]|nr:IS110 family transposase [Deltaproteobacteria bacterium]